EDPLFAVRSVYLEYRSKHAGAGDGLVQRLPLYDQRLEWAVPFLSAKLAARPAAVPGPPLRLRPQRVPVSRRWSLRDLKLKEGDVLVLQACADDFDDVTVNKQPGRSHEVEIRVVSRMDLDKALNDAQGKVHEELLRLQQQQQEALKKVLGAE